jgi:hypothetical protein
MRWPIVLFSLLLIGCIDDYPTAFHVNTVAEAPAGKSFVYANEPWAPEMKIVAKTDTAVLTNIEGAKVSCANGACSSNGRSILINARPPGDRIEVTVEKDGFEPAHVVIPIPPGRGLPDVVIILRPKAAS